MWAAFGAAKLARAKEGQLLVPPPARSLPMLPAQLPSAERITSAPRPPRSSTHHPFLSRPLGPLTRMCAELTHAAA